MHGTSSTLEPGPLSHHVDSMHTLSCEACYLAKNERASPPAILVRPAPGTADTKVMTAGRHMTDKQNIETEKHHLVFRPCFKRALSGRLMNYG